MKKRDVFGLAGVVIFAGILLFFLCHPPSKKHYNPAADQNTKEACHNSGFFVVPPPPNENEHKNSKNQTDKEKWCAERSSLASQWKAADFTLWAFLAGGLGIWLVGWTLVATRQATSISRQTAERETRSYVTIKQIEGEESGVIVSLKNTGNTPAKNIKARAQWVKLTTSKGLENIDRSNLIKDEIIQGLTPCEMSAFSLGAHAECKTFINTPETLPFTSSVYQPAEHKFIYILIDLRIEYEDVFGRNWRAEHILTWKDGFTFEQAEEREYEKS